MWDLLKKVSICYHTGDRRLVPPFVLRISSPGFCDKESWNAKFAAETSDFDCISKKINDDRTVERNWICDVSAALLLRKSLI